MTRGIPAGAMHYWAFWLSLGTTSAIWEQPECAKASIGRRRRHLGAFGSLQVSSGSAGELLDVAGVLLGANLKHFHLF